MKKITFIFFLFISISHYAQIQDLFALSTGEFTNFSRIYDSNEDLYGYIAIYKKDNNRDKTHSFEAILFDTNLNKVSNVTFTSGENVSGYKAYMNINDEIIFNPKVNLYQTGYVNYKRFVFPEAIKIDFTNKSTEIYDTYCFNEEVGFEKCSPNKSWKEAKKELKQERKDKGYIYNSNVFRLKDKSYLVNEYHNYKKHLSDEKLKMFDAEQNFKWDYLVENEYSKKKGYHTLGYYKTNIKNKKDVAYFLILHINNKKETDKYELIGLDLKEGKEFLREDLAEKILKVTSKSLVRTELKEFIVDVRSLYNKRGARIGFRRMKLNLNTHQIEWDDLLFQDMINHVDELNKYGEIRGNYKLRPVAAFVNDDGSVYILTEEYKLGQNILLGASVPKNKSFHLIKTDLDFNVSKVNKIHKDKSKWAYSDFLFWQKLNKENNDIAFFYTDKRKDDETKKKNWMLGICTIIDGKFKNEEIQISSKSDKYQIIPYAAKRGYIMLREFNKKQEYNQIRLEKLNY